MLLIADQSIDLIELYSKTPFNVSHHRDLTTSEDGSGPLKGHSLRLILSQPIPTTFRQGKKSLWPGPYTLEGPTNHRHIHI